MTSETELNYYEELCRLKVQYKALRDELNGIKVIYEKRQRELVENAEKELLKYAEKLK